MSDAALQWFAGMQAGQHDRTQLAADYSAQLTDEALQQQASLGQKMRKGGARLRNESTLVLVALCAAVSACSPVKNKEDMLAAAGFTLVPANTPQRQASLSELPPHKFVHQVRNNVVIFTYADPTICDCLYVGNQAAYDRYRQEVFAQNIANEQEMTAQMNQMDWGPWGPGWYY